MTEEYKYRYRSDRVLLDYRQFLPDEKPGQAVFLTAAELQMLRNMCEYLDRRTTWVFQYHANYYDGPDDTDWDMIQGLAADLEEKLMPNNVVPWGYTERWAETIAFQAGSSGVVNAQSAAVSAGWVHKLEYGHAYNSTRGPTFVQVELMAGAYNYPIVKVASPGLGVYVPMGEGYTLAEGDSIRVAFSGTVQNDLLIVRLWGVKMAVPS